MTYEDFLEIVSELASSTDEYFKAQWTEGYIESRTYVGGYSGGSCWGGEPSYSACFDPDPKELSLDLLVAVLLKCNSAFSLKDYSEVLKLIECVSETESEYYGNTSEYVVLRISTRQLYDLLCQMSSF